MGEGPETDQPHHGQPGEVQGRVLTERRESESDQPGKPPAVLEVHELVGQNGLGGHVPLQHGGELAPELAQHGLLGEGLGQYAQHVLTGRGVGRQPFLQRVEPGLPAAVEQREQDAFTGLEVADHIGLRRAQPPAQLTEADLVDRDLAQQFLGRVQDDAAPLFSLLGPAGALEIGSL